VLKRWRLRLSGARRRADRVLRLKHWEATLGRARAEGAKAGWPWACHTHQKRFDDLLDYPSKS
jgi:hypothetical protein